MRLAFFSVLLMFVQLVSAQLKQFTDDPNKFLGEMTSLYTVLENKDDRKSGEAFMLEKFTPFWNGGYLTDPQKKTVIANCNQMMKKKMKAYPHFMNYMVSLLNMSEAGKLPAVFDPWHQTLDKLMGKSTSNSFLSFLSSSDSLFLANYLYVSNTTKWVASNSTYDFTFEEEPVVFFPSLILTCYANNDSSVIYDTRGKYYPLQKKWVGERGRIDWKRAGLNPDDVYATFGRYEIELKSREYSVDSVEFHNKEFFGATPLPGRIEEKVLANRSGDNALYPQFTSYDKRLAIKDIYKDVDYEGGFSMHGPKLLGSGDEYYDAILSFKKDGQVFLVSRSKSFSIRHDRVNSDRASVAIYFEGDSIYHPGLIMRYIDKQLNKDNLAAGDSVWETVREISFIRDDEGLRQTPFFNTYHKVDMYFEALYWKLDDPMIDFRMIKGPGSSSEGLFESANYYSEGRFEKLKGINDLHPFQSMKNYCNQIGSRAFSVPDYAGYRRIQVEGIRAELIDYAIKGFVIYDPNTDKVFVKDKVFDYLNAKVGKADYDVIQFHSVIEKESNATFSLLNWDMKIRGVSRVFLSDSQAVIIYPNDQEIILKKNRDFTFAGRVHAGMFDYYGKNFSFEYDKFKLNLPIIDSMTFKVRSRTPDEYGEYPLIRVKSVIEDLSGDILIDHPNNKSGRKPFPEYPIFNSKKFSFVYWDKNSDYPGSYPRDNFFYRIDPFTLDSLDDFETDALEFKGYLSSAGIFPDITQPLKVMKDYSLGFIHNTGPAGYPTYGGKGTFTNIIDLSNKGLFGSGTLKYLSSESKSDNFLFFPDHMTAKVKDYVVKEQTSPSIPPVEAHNVMQEWKPYEDQLAVTTTDQPAKLYKEETEMTGTLNITPGGLTGSGKLDFRNASMTSDLFKFKERTFDTDTCDFYLKTADYDELAFETKNYKGHVDFDEKKGEFKSNGGTSLVSFPVNEYICYMDQFDWYMDKDEIDLQNNAVNVPGIDKMDIKELADLDLAGSEFISTHPAQDSLRFRSSRAKYSLREKVIYASDVMFIKVADATIFPGDGNVTILKKAEMVPLENAQILANNTTKYHTISSARVSIYGKNSYSGEGYYDYIDEMDGMQRIFLDKVAVDSTIQTYAHGYIKDSLEFTLSPYFDFYGDVRLTASAEFLTFDGGVRIKHQCDTLGLQWLSFETEIDPQNIFIPVPEMINNTKGDRIYCGLYLNRDSIGVYPAFLSRKFLGGDPELAASSGFLTYDHGSNEYRVSSKDKLAQPVLPGKYMSLSVYKCMSRNEGKLSFGDNFGRLKMNNYGIIDHSNRDSSTMIYSVSELDFFLAPDALTMFEQTFDANPELEPTNVRSELYTKYLGEIMTPEDAEKAESELVLYGYFKKLPEKLEHTITFSDLTLKYNPKTKSYLSQGKIGIATVGKTQVNKYVDGKMELSQKRSGDRLTFILDLGSDWFFFDYYNGNMAVFSSKKEWNDIIINSKPEDRELKAKDGEKLYRYTYSSSSKKEKWLKKVNEGTEEEEGEGDNGE
ncbi:hypothetical protein SDC9_61535 [bioreactor metagenome]|uniref:Uncharacterized protein n=1 Tax=bioreactor metagenome TaxID=1076179 RepID=A0A644XGE6_9ZZZZ